MEQTTIAKPTPTPCNAKSLLAFTFGLMAKLISQANNTMKNEILRAALKLKMYEQHTGIEASEVRLREIESKPFNENV